MDRRHVDAAEIGRLPQIAPPPNWTVSEWVVAPAADGDGHHDDFIATLTGSRYDDGLEARVIITSYDLDGRTDEQLVKWVHRKAVEEIATARRRAA